MDEISIKMRQFKKRLKKDPSLPDRISKCESVPDLLLELDILDIFLLEMCKKTLKGMLLTMTFNCPICKKEQTIKREAEIIFRKGPIICRCPYCNNEFDLESSDEDFRKFRKGDYNFAFAATLELFLEANKRGLLGDEGISEKESQSLSELSQALNKMLLSKGLLEKYHKDEKTGEIRIIKEEQLSF